MSDQDDNLSVSQWILITVVAVCFVLVGMENTQDFISDRGWVGFSCQVVGFLAFVLAMLCEVKLGDDRIE